MARSSLVKDVALVALAGNASQRGSLSGAAMGTVHPVGWQGKKCGSSMETPT